MLKTLQSLIPIDRDYPARVQRMQWLASVLNGSLYDPLDYAFCDERSPSGEYVPISKRRPSVRYNLSRVIVNDSVSMLFSEGRFPRIQTDDEETSAALEKIVKDCRLNEVMVEAAIVGSVGSVAVLFQVLNGRVFYKALPTTYLTPSWNPVAPDQLVSVTEQYKVRGDMLASQGYAIDDDDRMSQFWFMRTWGANAETWFVPWLVNTTESITPQVDTKKTVNHNLGFVPMVWIKNLSGGDDIDGTCTFEQAIPAQVEIEYQLSQAGRGLKYSSDPLLMIKEPPSGGGDIIKGSNALVVSSDGGDAKLLEISGSAAAAVIEYAKALRMMALETVGGNRADADKLSAAQSGRAMELMNQSLIWLADKLRVSYGEGALLDLMNMAVRASTIKLVDKQGRPIGEIKHDAEVSLKWPRWYHSTAEDRQQDATTLNTLRAAKLISQETAVGAIADEYDIEDVEAELKKLSDEDAANMDKLAAISGVANANGAEDGVMIPPAKDKTQAVA